MTGEIERKGRPDNQSGEEKRRFSGRTRQMLMSDLQDVRIILEDAVLLSHDPPETQPGKVARYIDGIVESLEKRSDSLYFVAETADGAVVGMVGMRKPTQEMHKFTTTDKALELINMYVLSGYRGGQGVGTALVEEFERVAIARGFTEVVLNSGPSFAETAWGFYDRRPGYNRVGIAEAYYGYDEQGTPLDAPVWRKQLT